MTEHDTLAVLALLDPFDEEISFDAHDEALLLRILETPLTQGRSARRVRRRNRVAAGVAAAAIGAVGATAAFGALRPEQATAPTTVVCYAAADLSSTRAVLPASTDPITSCARAWIDGTLSSAGAAELTGCRLDTGAAAVFPGDRNVCAALGLAPLAVGSSVETQAIADLQSRISAEFSRRCYGQAEALRTAQQMLDESGLQGWSVELAEDFPPDLECAGGGPDMATRTVLIAGVRPLP
jgi:hypothetical protein